MMDVRFLAEAPAATAKKRKKEPAKPRRPRKSQAISTSARIDYVRQYGTAPDMYEYRVVFTNDFYTPLTGIRIGTHSAVRGYVQKMVDGFNERWKNARTAIAYLSGRV